MLVANGCGTVRSAPFTVRFYSGSVVPPLATATANVTSPSITVSWNSVSGATSYVVERLAPGVVTTSSTVTSTTFTDTNVVSGKMYAYRVKTVTSSSSSDFGPRAIALLKNVPATPAQGLITAEQFNYIWAGTCRMRELLETAPSCASSQTFVSSGDQVTKSSYEYLQQSLAASRSTLGLTDLKLRVVQVNQAVFLSDIVNLERGLQ